MRVLTPSGIFFRPIKTFREGHQVSQIRATSKQLFAPHVPLIFYEVDILEGFCTLPAMSRGAHICPTKFSGEVRARVQLTLAKPVTTTLHKRHDDGGGAGGGGSSRAIGGRDDTLLWEGPGYDPNFDAFHHFI